MHMDTWPVHRAAVARVKGLTANVGVQGFGCGSGWSVLNASCVLVHLLVSKVDGGSECGQRSVRLRHALRRGSLHPEVAIFSVALLVPLLPPPLLALFEGHPWHRTLLRLRHHTQLPFVEMRRLLRADAAESDLGPRHCERRTTI